MDGCTLINRGSGRVVWCASVFRVLDLLEDFVQTTGENTGLIKKKKKKKKKEKRKQKKTRKEVLLKSIRVKQGKCMYDWKKFPREKILNTKLPNTRIPSTKILST